MRTRRGRARLISEYVDARIGRRVEADARPDASLDEDFDQLLDLARELSELEMAPPRGAEDAVLQSVQRQVARAASAQRGPWFLWTWRLLAHRAADAGRRFVLQPAVVGLLLFAAVAGVWWFRAAETPVTASDLLARVDRLDALAAPGEVLHRVVRTTFRAAPGEREAFVTVVHEWLDGTGTRSAAQGYGEDGRLLWTQVTRADVEQGRLRMYLPPNPDTRPGGVMVVRPNTRDLREALGTLPSHVRSRLEPILTRRGVVPEPIWSDRWENRVMLGVEARQPRADETLEVEPWTTPRGTRGYQLRAVDGWRPWVEWRGDGITGLPARFERVRYIDGDAYLTLRETAEYRLDDGRVFAYERETRSSERLSVSAAEPRFALDVPPGTPVHRASAADELRALADAIRQKP